MVANMEEDKVADMEVYMVAHIDINIQFGDGYTGLSMRPNNNFVRKNPPV